MRRRSSMPTRTHQTPTRFDWAPAVMTLPRELKLQVPPCNIGDRGPYSGEIGFVVAKLPLQTHADAERLQLFASNPDIEKARAEFERTQKVEERFHKDFDGP